jgi:hypothetical protein
VDILETCTMEIQACTEQWTDNRVIHIDDLEDLLTFWIYLPRLLSQSGLRYKGYQLRQRDGSWLLVVKATQGDTPLVVFLTSATPTGCVRLMVSQIEDDRLKWVRDKYPWS